MKQTRALVQEVEVCVVGQVDRCARIFAWTAMLALVLVLVAAPHLAVAQALGGMDQLCTNAQQAVKWVFVGIYFILVVAVGGAAVAASFGRLEWAVVGRILVGCIVAGLAVALVQALSGLSGTC
jgi:hypothetical protein